MEIVDVWGPGARKAGYVRKEAYNDFIYVI